MPIQVPVNEFTPDQPALYGGAGEAKNVLPGINSYRPLQSFQPFSLTPLSARAQGAFYCRDESTAHLAVQVAGDATKLYLLTGTAWVDASRLVGGAYATVANDFWDFDQFGSLIIAVNGTDVPQKLDISASPGSNFAALTGTPPTGPKYIAIMGDFVVMANMPGDSRLVQWSAINDGEDYVASATTQSDAQEIPDGGSIAGLFGYEYGGLIFQERAIRRMDYEGSPVIFRFKRIADGIGATIPGSIAGFGDRSFFWHRSGAFMVAAATQIVPIGAAKVDDWFWNDPVNGVDQSYLANISSAVDPVNKVWGVLYSAIGSSGVLNRLILFHWDTGKWSRAEPGTMEMIYSGTAHTGLTLEDLDIYGTIEAVPFPFDSPVWTGVPAPLFAAFDTSHNLGYFNGANLEATVDTLEAQIFPGKRALITRARPIVQGGSGLTTLAIGKRNQTQDAVAWDAAAAMNSIGYVPLRNNGRLQRARIVEPAGSTWTHLQGVDDLMAHPVGQR